MANKKISELQSRTPSLSDLLLVGDPSSGYSYKCTVTALATIIETDIADGYVTIGTTQTISGAKTFSNNLALTSVSNANTDTDKFLVLNASNVVNFRTGAEVLSDIGGQGALTLTTTGSSGASTLVGNTLNIPTYTLSGLGGISGSGTPNYIPKFTGSSSIGNSVIYESSSNIGIGTISPAQKLEVIGTLRVRSATEILDISAPLGKIDFNNVSGDPIGFSIGSSERMRLDASGNLVLGNTTVTNSAGYGRILNIYNSSSAALGLTIPSYDWQNGVESDGALRWRLNGTARMLIDASGNLGLGVTPSAWGSGYIAQQIGTRTALISGTLGQTFIGNNNYNNGTNWLYLQTAATSLYEQYAGSHVWYNAPSGTAGNAISFTQAMTLDASGRLGIGTTSPGSKLEINGDGNFKVASGNVGYSLTSNTTAYSFYLNSGDNSYRIYSSIGAADRVVLTSGGNLGLGVTPQSWWSSRRAIEIFNGGAFAGVNAGWMEIWGNSYLDAVAATTRYLQNGFASLYQLGNIGSGGHAWYTAPSGTAGNAISFTQAMTLDASGRLGIGLTNPSVRLDVSGQSQITDAANGFNINLVKTDGYGALIQMKNTSALSNALIRVLNSSNVIVSEINPATNGIAFTTGNVGIGTTSPSYKLQVQGPVPVNEAISDIIMITDNASNSGYLGIARSSSTQNGLALSSDGKLVFRVGSTTEAMTIRSSGNVGIGTTSPTSISNYIALTINGTSGSFTEYQENGGRAFRIGSDGATGGFISQTSADPIRIFTSSTERMRITSGGDVGIGVTSPGAKLEVNGAIKTSNPSGGTAKPWKLGEAVSTAVTLSGYAVVEIDGVAYKLALVTAN